MKSKGFTLVELMIVVVVLGVLAAIAIPNYRNSRDRAKEAQLKANMHSFQLAAEDFRVRADSVYAGEARDVAPLVSQGFVNPFDRRAGEDRAWEDRWMYSQPPTPLPGIVSYADSADGGDYSIKGYGRSRVMPLELNSTSPDYSHAPKDDARQGGFDERRRGPGTLLPRGSHGP